MNRWKIAFPFALFGFMALLVVWSNARGGGDDTAPGTTPIAGRLLDPVCNMDVNAGWDVKHEHEGTTFYFCHDLCKQAFAADPFKYITDRCLVCSKPVDSSTAVTATYLDKTYHFDNETCRREFKSDPAAYFMHTMWGLPDELYYLSIVLVLLVSFMMFEGRAAFGKLGRWFGGNRDDNGGGRAMTPGVSAGGRRADAVQWMVAVPRSIFNGRQVPPPAAAGAAAVALPVLDAAGPGSGVAAPTDRINLMQFNLVKRFLLSRRARFVIQAVMAVMFIVIVAAGLFGNQNPSLNVAPLLTWTIWWCGLVVLIMFAGKAWCYMCPWDGLAGWMEKLRLWKKTDDGMGLGLPWPRWLRNVWLATFLFIGLTWVELGFGITMSPRATAYIAVAMVVMTIVCVFLFDRKSFCRYGCLVGRVSGLYALFAGVEVRAADGDVCRDCRTKECVKGSDTAYGCPTFEYPAKMEVNTYCIQCAECLQACPHDNMAVNLRPWGADLAAEGKPRSDEAYLALLMLAISGFHGLTMTPVWGQLTGSIESAIPLGRIVSFTAGMAALMAGPIIVYALLAWLSFRIGLRADPVAAKRTTFRDYFIRYAYCVLPIALFYHLAHNLEHLLMEGPKVLALVSDPFGWNWNLFGTAGWHVPPLVSLEMLWILQIVLVAVGHVYSLWAAQKISRRVFTNPAAAARGQWIMLLGMIAFSVFSLWLLKQPMEMRISAM